MNNCELKRLIKSRNFSISLLVEENRELCDIIYILDLANKTIHKNDNNNVDIVNLKKDRNKAINLLSEKINKIKNIEKKLVELNDEICEIESKIDI